MITIQMKDIPIKNDTPVLSYCRQLIKEGFHFNTKLKVYRSDVLAIIVKRIGQGAKLTVDKRTTKFVRYRMPLQRVRDPSQID